MPRPENAPQPPDALRGEGGPGAEPARSWPPMKSRRARAARRTDNRSRSPGSAASSAGANAAQGSRQTGSVTSGKGVALTARRVRTGTDAGIPTVY